MQFEEFEERRKKLSASGQRCLGEIDEELRQSRESIESAEKKKAKYTGKINQLTGEIDEEADPGDIQSRAIYEGLFRQEDASLQALVAKKQLLEDEKSTEEQRVEKVVGESRKYLEKLTQLDEESRDQRRRVIRLTEALTDDTLV